MNVSFSTVVLLGAEKSQYCSLVGLVWLSFICRVRQYTSGMKLEMFVFLESRIFYCYYVKVISLPPFLQIYKTKSVFELGCVSKPKVLPVFVPVMIKFSKPKKNHIYNTNWIATRNYFTIT